MCTGYLVETIKTMPMNKTAPDYKTKKEEIMKGFFDAMFEAGADNCAKCFMACFLVPDKLTHVPCAMNCGPVSAADKEFLNQMLAMMAAEGTDAGACAAENAQIASTVVAACDVGKYDGTCTT